MAQANNTIFITSDLPEVAMAFDLIMDGKVINNGVKKMGNYGRAAKVFITLELIIESPFSP